MILYPGLDPVTIWPTFTSGYGSWSGGLVVEGGDQRNAANHMAAVEAATDRLNVVGWRVAYLNPIEGVQQSDAIWTSAIFTKNAWGFIGDCVVTAGGTLNITSTGVAGVLADGRLRIKGTSGHPGKIVVEGFGQIEVESGGLINCDAGSTFSASGVVIIDKDPGTGDPGADNMVTGSNIVHARGCFSTDGAGGKTLHSGYNIGSHTFNASTAIEVTFARALPNDDYTVVVSDHSSGTATVLIGKGWGRSTTLVQLSLFSDPSTVVSLTGTATNFSFVVFSDKQ